MKYKPQIGRKYFQATYPTKPLYQEYVKNSLNSIVRKPTSPMRKWEKKIEKPLHKREHIYMANKYMIKCSTLLTTKKYNLSSNDILRHTY